MAEHDDHRAPDAPPTAEELARAEALRDALADPSRRDPDAELARGLALAHSPRDLDGESHRALLERALGPAVGRPAAPGPAVTPSAPRASARVIRVTFGALAATLAAAASVVLYLSAASPRSAAVAASAGLPATSLATPRAAPLAQTRSTAPLFDAPFARGGASARIDRIASARASDLRENRFRRWGVR